MRGWPNLLFPVGNISASYIKNIKAFSGSWVYWVGGLGKDNIRDYYSWLFFFYDWIDLIPKMADESMLIQIKVSAKIFLSTMKELSG